MDNRNGVHIIDCSQISESPLAEIQDTEEFKDFSHKFGNAMKLNGIVYLINTGVGDDIVANLEKKLSEFYSLPVETKRQYNIASPKDLMWGWTEPSGIRVAHADTKETFDFESNPKMEDDSLYPKEVSGFKEALLAFRKKTKDLSTKVLRSLGEYFQLEDKDVLIRCHRALEENYAKSKFSVRTLFYPVQEDMPTNAAEMRLLTHQDYGTITYLYQNSGVGGLQVKLHNGDWVDVEYIPNSFVVNAGRSLEMWTGGNIPAVLHRVAWTEKSKIESRISFGCFLDPDRDASCLPLVKENPDWTPIYNKMEKGETYDEWFAKQIALINAKRAARYAS